MDLKNHWMKEVKDNGDPGTELILVLNKMDLDEKKLNGREIQKFAKKEGLTIYETSAKTGKNVTTLFLETCRKLIQKE